MAEVKAESAMGAGTILGSRLRNWIGQLISATGVHASRRRLRLCETVSLGDKRFVALLECDGKGYLLAGTSQGRLHEQDVTVFDSVGFALEDFSALSFLQEAALETGLGSWVQLVPQAGDPKDLFGALGEIELVPHEATAGC